MSEKPTYEELEQRNRELEQAEFKLKRAEKALMESEAKTKAILEAMPDLMFRLSEEGEHLDFYTPRMEELYLDPDEFLGKSVHEVLPREVGEKYQYHIQKALETCQMQVFEYQLEFPEGPRDYEGRMVVSGDNETLTIIRDITERKQTDKRLQESEAHYRELFVSNPQPMWIYDLETLAFLDVNNAAISHYGYSREEFLSMTLKDIRPAEDVPRLLDNVDRVSDGLDEAGIWCHIKKDGNAIDVEITSHVLQYKQRRAEIVLAYDITERKRAEESLKKSERRYRTLFEKTTDAIFIVERSTGRYLDANLAATRLSGRKLSELKQMTTNDVTPHEYSKRLGIIAKSNETQELGKVIYLRPDGTHRVAILTAVPLDSKAIIGIARDITDELAMEVKLRQAQKMEAIGTLAGGIAHDFNNILSAIIGFTEISLENVEKDSKLYNNLQEVFRAGRRAKDLVKQILTYSRQTEEERKPIQVKFIVKEALKFARASLPTTIEVRQDIKSDAMILADPTNVHQILMNLCTNAGQAMQDKGGVLEIKLEDIELDAGVTAGHTDLKPGVYLILTVSDTGPGMPPQVLERIFDPFFTTKEPGEGTGMGLSVVHGIVTSYEGAITACSEPGQGAIFKVYLPIIEIRKEPEMGTEELIPIGSECILYIDDEPALAKLGKQTLESLGYEVVIRTSSIEALELFKAQPDKFDLVITDMTMPHMTGEDLAEELIRIRPEIPVILCTGYSAKVDEQQAISMNIQAFIMKPVVKREMAVTIRKVLGQKVKNDSGSTANILIVDDDVQFRTMLQQMLETERYKVKAASNGKEGIRLFRENPTDLIITDIIMPEKEGIEMIMDLKKDFPNVKIIAVSGGGRIASDDYLHMAKMLGAKFTFTKPFERKELLNAVKEIIG